MPSPNGSSATSSVSPASVGGIAQYLICGEKWGGGLGSGFTLTYSFPGADAIYTSGYEAGEPASDSPFSAADQTAATAALMAWAAAANVRFQQVTETVSNVGDIRFAFYGGMDADSAAYAYLPGGAPEGGDVWVNPDNWPTGGGTIAKGSYPFNILLHEIGHAIGLKHPFEAPVIPAQYDSYKYTVMSYTAWTGSGDNYASFYPTTPMYYDMVAIQALYGVNTTYKTGNDTYTFTQGVRYFQTIYDAGGADTIAFSGTRGVVINLVQGAFSSVSDTIYFNGGVHTNSTVAIGPRTIIENAIGGSGSDYLYGNSANNILNGGAGADRLAGATGSDTYYVDNAGDVVTESASQGFDRVIATINYTIGTNVEGLTLAGSAGVGAGNAHANSIIGNASNNSLYGQYGDDVINGAAGNDVIYGGLGLDTLTGGSGADYFVFNSALGSGNVDHIADFSVAADTIRLENAVFTALPTAGVLSSAAFHIGAAAADASDRIVYNSTNGALIYDSNGSAAAGALQFATLAAHLALTNQDFVII